MKENWGPKGMPPLYIEVRHRAIEYESDTFQAETVWIEGHHPQYGKQIEGWSGPETVVRREIVKKPGAMGKYMEPGIIYPIIMIKK